MSDADIAARLVDELSRVAAGAAPKAGLVSVAIDILAPGDVARIDPRIDRQTRTLLFLSADARDAAGARVASASSVHKILT